MVAEPGSMCHVGRVAPDESGNPEDGADRLRDRAFLCRKGDHSGCPHLPFETAIQLLPVAGRLVVSGPPELDFTLCRCPCHADCLLAGRADAAGWPEGCSCNETLNRIDLSRRFPASDGGINPFSG